MRASCSISRSWVPGSSPNTLPLLQIPTYSWGKEVSLGFSGLGNFFSGALSLCHVDSCGADCSPVIQALPFPLLRPSLYFCSAATICLIFCIEKGPSLPFSYWLLFLQQLDQQLLDCKYNHRSQVLQATRAFVKVSLIITLVDIEVQVSCMPKPEIGTYTWVGLENLPQSRAL